MTPHLPETGTEAGSWGNSLNEFLRVSHNEDGTAVLPAYSGLDDGQALGYSDTFAIERAGVKKRVAGSAMPRARKITQAAHGFQVGDCLALSSSTYVGALATSLDEARVLGMVAIVFDSGSFLLMPAGGYVAGIVGLTAGAPYWLSPTTRGRLTATQPTVATHVSKLVFVADSTGSGYFLNGPSTVVGGSTISAALTRTIQQPAHGLSVGNVVRETSTGYELAQADSGINADSVGIVSAIVDADTFTLTMAGGYISSGLAGVTPHALHFLSADTAGFLTTTEPTDVGSVRKEMLWADGLDSGYVLNTLGIVVQGQAGAGDIPIADAGEFYVATEVETALQEIVSTTPRVNYATTSVTLALTDAGHVVELANASPITLTIPANATVAFPIGTKVTLWQQGSGQVSVTAAGGVTLRVPASKGAKLKEQYATAWLYKRATNEWLLDGTTAA